jgi:predicted MFS family arabinose efflux permease
LIRLIFLITFIESLVTSLVERGILFYAEDQLGFSQAENLWLALLFGLAYVVGALGSHRASRALGERRWLVLMIVTHFVLHMALATEPSVVLVFVLNTVLGLSSGSKWPVIESFMSAGLTPREAVSSVGRFNMAWSSSVVIAVAVSGYLIEIWPPSLFLVPAALNVVTFVLLWRLPAKPVHLEHDHPHRPNPRQITRLKSLLVSSRWSMFGSYTLMFLLAPLLPFIFADRLMFDPGPATIMASLIDLSRFLTFFAMWLWIGWHGKRSVLVLGVAMMPIGFLMTLLGGDLGTVLLGEIVFGAAAGMTYYAALYYAMVVQNAAVEAGGAHEGLIGSGFAVGPAIGLVGISVGGAATGSPGLMAATTAPFLILCAVAGLWTLRKARAEDQFHFPE